MKYKFAPALITKSFATLYDPLTNFVGAGTSLQKKVINLSDMHNNDHILDVGCGTGTFVVLAATLYPHIHVTGVDPDDSILRIARQKLKSKEYNAQFIKVSAEKLPFKNASFDKVFSTLVFHHLPLAIKQQALKEIHRVLKKNGTFLLTDIGKPKNLLWKMLLEIEALFESREYLQDNLAGKIPHLVENAGFTIKEIAPSHHGIQFWLAQKTTYCLSL